MGLSAPDEKEQWHSSRPAILSNQRGSFQTFMTICLNLVICVSLEVKCCNSNCSFYAQLKLNELAWGCIKILGVLGLQGSGQGSWYTSKGLASVFAWILQIKKKQRPTVRVLQPSPPWLQVLSLSFTKEELANSKLPIYHSSLYLQRMDVLFTLSLLSQNRDLKKECICKQNIIESYTIKCQRQVEETVTWIWWGLIPSDALIWPEHWQLLSDVFHLDIKTQCCARAVTEMQPQCPSGQVMEQQACRCWRSYFKYLPALPHWLPYQAYGEEVAAECFQEHSILSIAANLSSVSST